MEKRKALVDGIHSLGRYAVALGMLIGLLALEKSVAIAKTETEKRAVLCIVRAAHVSSVLIIFYIIAKIDLLISEDGVEVECENTKPLLDEIA